MVGKPLPIRASVAPLGVGAAAPALPAGRWLLNLAAFQAAWLATVLGARHGLGWAGPVAVAAAVTVHLRLSERPRQEAVLLSVSLLLGVAVEHPLLWSGLIRYPDATLWVPVWMLALWPLLATTLNVSLAWLKPHPLVAAACGGLGGPLAYWGGAALGAIELPDPTMALTALAVAWAAAFPALLLAARRLSDPPHRVGRA